MSGASVYIVIDKADNPIYVGASRDVNRRLREHKSRDWWHLARKIEIYEQPDWEIALYVERNLIRRWSPEFNVQSTDPVEHAVNSIRQPMLRSLASVMS